MKFKFSPKLVERFPIFREGFLVIRGFSNQESEDRSYQLLCNLVDNRRSGLQSKKDVWTETFETLGLDTSKVLPSHRALTSRIFEGKELPNINTLVNVANAAQMQFDIPIGVHDLQKMDGDLTVGSNSHSLSHTSRQGELKDVNEEEVVHHDDKSVLTRNWVWRQGKKDLCTRDSTDIVFLFNSLDAEDNIEEMASFVINALNKVSKNKVEATFAILSRDKPEAQIEELEKFTSKPTAVIDKFQPVEISKNQKIIDRILNKAIEDILPSKDMLESMLLSGKRIKIYQGFDPTADTLHIGHTVMMRKLEDFRQLGHEVIFLMGNFTALIGDPSDKSSTRQPLTLEQTNENLKVYKEQASAIIDVDNSENPVKVLYNADWLGELKFADILELASEFTVQQMMKRSMFQDRLENEKPIGLHEFMYPLMQGFDSVAMDIDVEVGGNDQLFNMLAGRTLVKSKLNKEKIVIAGKLLTTTDGTKMGKSEGNMIKLSDSAVDIYGKVMAFADEKIAHGFELLTSADIEEVSEIEKKLEDGAHPMDLKKELAFRLTSELKGEEAAKEGETFFREAFQNKSTDVDAEVVETDLKSATIIEILTDISKIAPSKSQARRLVEQNAVAINGEKITDINAVISLTVDGVTVKAGKSIIKVKNIT